MQQIHALLYLFFYTLTLITLLIFFFEYVAKASIYTVSLAKFTVWIQQYTQTSYIYSLILISFSGLPPTALFFIKFQIIINCIIHWDFFIITLIFFFFFLNMIFYLQFFKLKTQWLYLHELFKKQKYFKTNIKISNITYNVRYLLHFILIFLFFIFFIFQDLIIIITNFINCYVRYI